MRGLLPFALGLSAALATACDRAPDESPIESARRYLDEGDLDARGRFFDAFENTYEQPPHLPLDVSSLEGDLRRALTHSDPARQWRGMRITSRIIVGHNSARLWLENDPHAWVDRSMLTRLVPFAAVGAANAHHIRPNDRFIALEGLAGLTIDEGHAHLDLALDILRPNADASPKLAYRYQKVRWWQRQFIIDNRLWRYHPNTFDHSAEDPLSICAAGLRASEPPALRPPVFGGKDAVLSQGRLARPPEAISAGAACRTLLDSLGCTPLTCEQRLIGDLAVLDTPLAVRRALTALALVQHAAPDVASGSGVATFAGDLDHCSDSSTYQNFCLPVTLGLIAEGRITEAEAALLMDASQLAWEFVDRPAWFVWP